jgi:hypothetical protein
MGRKRPQKGSQGMEQGGDMGGMDGMGGDMMGDF